jgi:citrate lyase beta subunit
MTSLEDAEAALREANLAFARRYPGERVGARQPVQTLIEGAQHFTSDVAARRGAAALAALDTHAPDAAALGRALGIEAHPALDAVYARVREKLAREPVEDYRVDFEDGFGVRSDDEEDRWALAVAGAIARGMHEHTLPASIGPRVKPLTEELRARSVRTLGLLVGALAEAGGLPARWVVTLPKVSVVEQVAYFAAVLRATERAAGLADGALHFEIQVEVPQIVVDHRGRSLLPRILDASDGRLEGVNLGVYDYTAALGITAAEQRLRHPACDFARHVVQAALAGTGVWLADGSTARLPVGDAEGVHAGWRLHFDDVRHSLAAGWHQGWDLHPAQLVSRYAAATSFFLEGVEAAGARLRAFLDRATQVALVGGVLDEPATGQGLLGLFHRAIAAGALSVDEAVRLTTLTRDELREPSFVRVLAARAR